MAIAPGLLLAALRWFGFLFWLPALATAGINLRMRIALALLLAIVVMPATAAARHSVGDLDTPLSIIFGGLAAAGGEFVLGSLLGLGVRVVFSALQLAGELVDQQAGLALQQVLNPVADEGTGPSSAVLIWLGVTAFFAATPSGGDLALADAMLRQFAAIPVGSFTVDASEGSLLVVLVQQALSLAVRVAAPVLAVMSLITMATGWLGRTTPQLQLGPLVAPVRVVVSLALLAAAIPGAAELLTERFDALLGATADAAFTPPH
jgi:flagellar biosynthetic protein FliR